MLSTTPSEARVSRERAPTHRTPAARTTHGSPQLLLGLGLAALGAGAALALGIAPVRGTAELTRPLGFFFAIVGTVMLWGGFRDATAAAARGVAPWRADGFDSPVLTAGIGHGHRIVAMQAALCFGFAAWLLGRSTPGSGARLMVLAFLAGGVASILYMGWTQLRRWKFGHCRLVIRNVPTRPGEPLQLVFRGGSRLADTDLELRLQCIEHELHQTTGDGTRIAAYRIFEERRSEHTRPDGDALLSFHIPADLPGTRLRVGSRDNAVYWRLAVAADIPGLDYRADFLLPIYRG